MLTVSQLQVHYGKIPALHKVSMHIESGEIVALLGSNGAGKTTTLRAISGLVPYRGEIFFQQKNLHRIAAYKRIKVGIAHVPEGRGIFQDLTVEENLRLACWGAKDSDYEFMQHLFPQLLPRQKQVAKTLSGGEQQMLAIARALLRKPKLLLLDEPSMGLSPKLMQEVFAALKKINEEGVSILLVEQNAYMALNLAHRAYILENGRIGLHGQAASLSKDPKVKELYLG